jgi:hypothetical protein
MTVRRLVASWLWLMALTVLAGVFAGLSQAGQPSRPALAALGVVIVAKARLILARYLRLEGVPGVLAGFTMAVAAVMGIVTLTFLVDLGPNARRFAPSANSPPPPTSVHQGAPSQP